MTLSTKVTHKTVNVGDLDIFYREAGPDDAPVILLLHGFPTSSHMFRNLIPLLANEYHVVAPDYPGFGHSSMPSRDEFPYTFDNLAKVIEGFTEKVGAEQVRPVCPGLRGTGWIPAGGKASGAGYGHVVQNGNAYDEGLENPFWEPIKAYWREPSSREKHDALRNFLTYDATRWQYSHGIKNPELVSPDGPAHDQFLLDQQATTRSNWICS
jgi:alpha/beta hydrolase fold